MTIFDEISHNYAFLDIEIKFSSWEPKECEYLREDIANKTQQKAKFKKKLS